MTTANIPKLTPQVQLLIHEEYLACPKANEYALEQMLRIQKENPYIFNFITNYAATAGEGPLSHVTGMLLVYRLLEAQAAANSVLA